MYNRIIFYFLEIINLFPPYFKTAVENKFEPRCEADIFSEIALKFLETVKRDENSTAHIRVGL